MNAKENPRLLASDGRPVADSATTKECMDYNEMQFAAKVNEMAQALQTGTMPHELHTGPVPELVQWLARTRPSVSYPKFWPSLKVRLS